MLIKDLMTRDVSSCSPENNLAELAELMRNHQCGALPIVDSTRRIAMVT
jgi:CBS-domain-containing membrane protein